MAERAVRSVKHGARTILSRSGLTENFWPRAIRHWCFARNTRKRAPGATAPPGLCPAFTNAFTKRHGGHSFKGQRVPFGALVDFKQTTLREMHQSAFLRERCLVCFWAITFSPEAGSVVIICAWTLSTSGPVPEKSGTRIVPYSVQGSFILIVTRSCSP